MYQELRSTKAITYEKVEKMFEDHQDKWPEAIFNEDAQYKYLDPLINDNDASYLGMLQGSKEEQRKWWLYNRFRYIDSKYNAGDALTDIIQLRGYAKANITVTPYADIYPAVKYGSYLVSARGQRNVPMTLTNPLDNVNDTEIYIYSCSQLSSVGDISGLKVGFADFSKAIKLQSLKIGDNTAGYTNENLKELYLGNNTLLQTIDVRNCTGLTQAVDISGCIAIENVYFDGTSITGLTLPNGGVVKVLHLPGTLTNLTVLNQPGITDFTCPDFSNITTLRLENVSSQFDPVEIIGEMAAGSRIRLYNFNIRFDSLEDAVAFYDVLDTMRGLDQNGNNMDKAQLYGTIYIPSLSSVQLEELRARYSDVTITYGQLISKLFYYDYYGNTLLYTETVANNQSGTWSDTPTKPTDTAQYAYGSFAGWALTPESDTADAGARSNLTGDRNVYAAFPATIQTYTATFIKSSTDGGGTLYTQQNIPYGTTPTYGGTTPTSTRGNDFIFNSWSPVLGPITGNITYTAVFKDLAIPLYKYLRRTITEYESDNVETIGKQAFLNMTTLETVRVSAASIETGAFQNCTALTEVDLTTTDPVSIDDYAFSGCAALKRVIIRSNSVASLTRYSAFSSVGHCLIYVPDDLVNTYKSTQPWNNREIINRIYGISDMYTYEWSETEITDSDAALFAAINNGTAHNIYKPGSYRTINLGTEGQIKFVIAGFNMRELANSTDTAEVEWVGLTLLKTRRRMNPAYEAGNSGTGALGGYDASEMATYINDTILPLFPEAWRNMMKEVKLVTDICDVSGTKIKNYEHTGKLTLLSSREVGMANDETTGPTYTDMFTDSATRTIKDTGGHVNDWWLRTAASGTAAWNIINTAGNGTNSGATSAHSIVLRFST